MLFEQARRSSRALFPPPAPARRAGAMNRVGGRWNKRQCAPRVSRSTSTACRTAARRRAPSRQEPTSPPRAPERGGKGRRCVRGLRSSLGARVSGQDFCCSTEPRRAQCRSATAMHTQPASQSKGRRRTTRAWPRATPSAIRTNRAEDKGTSRGIWRCAFFCPGTSVSVRMAVPIAITSGPA